MGKARQVGSLQGLNTWLHLKVTLRTHTSGQRGEMGRVVARQARRTTDWVCESTETPYPRLRV